MYQKVPVSTNPKRFTRHRRLKSSSHQSAVEYVHQELSALNPSGEAFDSDSSSGSSGDASSSSPSSILDTVDDDRTRRSSRTSHRRTKQHLESGTFSLPPPESPKHPKMCTISKREADSTPTTTGTEPVPSKAMDEVNFSTKHTN